VRPTEHAVFVPNNQCTDSVHPPSCRRYWNHNLHVSSSQVDKHVCMDMQCLKQHRHPRRHPDVSSGLPNKTLRARRQHLPWHIHPCLRRAAVARTMLARSHCGATSPRVSSNLCPHDCWCSAQWGQRHPCHRLLRSRHCVLPMTHFVVSSTLREPSCVAPSVTARCR
jgi:hypothetical protein